jgi:NAD(P)-dependent dehydrogenase (short-subunit alcohol dehydrogenase family)
LQDKTVVVVGRGSDIERRNLQLSFDTKVIGPTMLAKYFARLFNPGGPLVVFSGVHAFKLNVGYLGVGITNGAVDFLTRRLAVELAPIRVNAISPGVIDTGAWDSLGDEGSGITSSTSPPATRRDGSGPLRMW